MVHKVDDAIKVIIVKTPSEFGRYREVVNSIDYEIDRHGKIIYER